jgi:hypothetical protein
MALDKVSLSLSVPSIWHHGLRWKRPNPQPSPQHTYTYLLPEKGRNLQKGSHTIQKFLPLEFIFHNQFLNPSAFPKSKCCKHRQRTDTIQVKPQNDQHDKLLVYKLCWGSDMFRVQWQRWEIHGYPEFCRTVASGVKVTGISQKHMRPSKLFTQALQFQPLLSCS